MSRNSKFEHHFGRAVCSKCDDNEMHKGRLKHVNGKYICESCIAESSMKECPGQYCNNTAIEANEDYCGTCQFMTSIEN